MEGVPRTQLPGALGTCRGDEQPSKPGPSNPRARKPAAWPPAAELPSCKGASAEHERCFSSVVNTGRYKGRMGCGPELDAMKAALKKHGLHPFPTGKTA